MGDDPKAKDACGVFGVCTVGKRLEGVACCVGCESYTPISPAPPA